MGYTTTATGHRDLVKKSSDTKVLRMMYLNGWAAVIVQTQTVTEETWVGLSKSDAESLCTSSETSTLGSTTRSYLGGVTVSSGLASIYDNNCWGTKVSSQIQRMGDTNLYQVSKTTTVLDVYAPSGTVTKW